MPRARKAAMAARLAGEMKSLRWS
jgi:hypothetical protein